MKFISETASAQLRVAVIDSFPLFRLGVAQALRNFEKVELVAEGACAADALRIAGKHPLDIMLIDLAIPGGGMKRSQPSIECGLRFELSS